MVMMQSQTLKARVLVSHHVDVEVIREWHKLEWRGGVEPGMPASRE